MEYLETVLKLPPGPVSTDGLRGALRLIFEEWHWFEPTRFGRVTPDQDIPSGRPVIDAIMEAVGTNHWVAVGSRGDKHMLLLSMDKARERSHLGRLTWLAPADLGRDPAWREAQAIQNASLMRHLDSPYAYAGLDEDMWRKTHRETADDRGFTIETFTVRDHGEGVAGLFWRNFFGAPFRELFGDRLKKVSRDLEGIALVEPYPDPWAALTDEGRAREEALIEILGRDSFYDHATQSLPTRRPKL